MFADIHFSVLGAEKCTSQIKQTKDFTRLWKTKIQMTKAAAKKLCGIFQTLMLIFLAVAVVAMLTLHLLPLLQ